MTTHVFVVDINTFKYHLEFMFAGTGAKEKQSTFLLDSNISFNATTERMLVGMIADISKIAIVTTVIMYVALALTIISLIDYLIKNKDVMKDKK